MLVTSRRRFFRLTANALAAAALDRKLLFAQEKSSPPLSKAIVTTKSGLSWTVAHPKLMYYFGKSEYWYSTRTSYRSYDAKPGNILLLQGWLWSEVPLSAISTITRTKVDYQTARDTTYKTLSGLPFKLDDYGADFFEVAFTDGTKTLAGLPATIHGKAHVKSLVGTYSANSSDIDSITVTEGPQATFHLHSGAVQENVFNIGCSQDGAYDTLTSHYTDHAELVVDCPGPQGGVMLTLEPSAFAGRTIVLTRSAPDITRPRDRSDNLSIAGLTAAPVDGELGWLRSDVEAFRCELDAMEGVCEIGGRSCRVFIDPDKIVSLSLSSVAGHTVVDAIQLRVADQTFAIPALRSLTFWYPQWASGYNDSSEKSSFTFSTGGITTEIALADVRSLAAASSGQTTLVLKNGESYSGSLQIDDGKPLGLVGAIEGGFGGFPATGCFILTDVGSLVFPA